VLAAHIYMDKAKHFQDCNDLDTIARRVLLDAKNKTFNTLEDAKKYLSTFKLSEESESIFNFVETPKLITTSNEITEETKEGTKTLYTMDLALCKIASCASNFSSFHIKIVFYFLYFLLSKNLFFVWKITCQ
jgi:hypothetical protein